MTDLPPEENSNQPATEQRKSLSPEIVDRGFVRPDDLRRLEYARELLVLGMHSAFINALLPTISEGRIKKISGVTGAAMKIGRPPSSGTALLKKASLHMDATLFAVTYQAIHAMSATPTSPLEMVSVPVLIDAYKAFSSLYSSPSLDINLAYVVVRDLLSKALSLDRCKLHDTEYLRSATQVNIGERYSNGECPHCRAQ